MQDQCIATAENHLETLIGTGISHGEMLGIEESKNMYPKRDHNDEDIKLIKKQLEDVHKVATGEQDKEAITADTVELSLGQNIQLKL